MIKEKYKTFWRRFLSGCADAIIFLPITLTSNWIWRHPFDFSILFLCIFYAITTLSWYIYEIWMLGKYGQTIGKMLLKVKVMNVSETTHITYLQAAKRNIVPIFTTIIILPYDIYQIINGQYFMFHPQTGPDAYTMAMTYILMAWFLLELITMLFSKKRRAVHDFIAGSVVIKATPTCA